MNLYVAEQEFDERGETTIKTVSEISQDELNALNEAFSFCGVSLDTQSDFQIVIERICDGVNISILAGVSLTLPYVSIVTENDLSKSAS